MPSTFRLRSIVVPVFALTMAASAAPIYDNGAAQSPLAGPELTVRQIASLFSLQSASVVTGFTFETAELAAPDFPGYAGAFQWGIYLDNSGSPVAIPLVSGVTSPARAQIGSTTQVLGNAGNLFENTVSISSLTLNPGIYWLALRNGSSPLTSFNGVLWAQSSSPNQVFASTTFNAAGWSNSGLSLAFQITGTVVPAAVPEPASLVLVGLGLAIGLVARLRQSIL